MSDFQDYPEPPPYSPAPADSPMVDALVSAYAWDNAEVTYAFTPGGSDTDKGPYSGGSDTTSDWSAAEQAVVESVFDHAEDLINLTFTEVGSVEDANMEFQVVESVPGGWAGYAGYPSDYFGSTIVMDDSWIDPRNGNTVVHEVGHALGLEHSHDGKNTFPGVEGSRDLGPAELNSEVFTTMSYNAAHDPLHPDLRIDAVQANFMAFDIAALQEIYGANMTTASGDDVYGQTKYLECIWDAGGKDSLDFSATDKDAVIDLRAATLEAAEGGGGYLSFVFDGSNYTTGGYTIAYGVEIETALGGGGDDQLRGNDAKNTLKGNAGADNIEGAGGGDTIRGGQDNDTLSGDAGNDQIKGEKGDDMITGDNGRDDLDGGSGKDTVKGGKGDDTISGGDGKDKLYGGKGADEFAFYAESGKDRIKDFDSAEDRLALDMDLFAGSPDGDDVVADHAVMDNGHAVFAFDDGSRLTLSDFGDGYTSDTAALAALGDLIDFI